MSEEPVTQSSNTIDVEGCVGLYLELRNTKAAITAKAAEACKPYTEGMGKLEAILLKHLQDTSSESVRTERGTVYARTVRSATTKDKGAFVNFVIETQNWDLVDMRPSKTEIFEFIEENQKDVPGINTSAVLTIGVRSPTEKE